MTLRPCQDAATVPATVPAPESVPSEATVVEDDALIARTTATMRLSKLNDTSRWTMKNLLDKIYKSSANSSNALPIRCGAIAREA